MIDAEYVVGWRRRGSKYEVKRGLRKERLRADDTVLVVESEIFSTLQITLDEGFMMSVKNNEDKN